MCSLKINETLDAKLVNAFVKATIDVFKHISVPNVNLVKVISEENFHPQGDVSAMVNISNNDGEGAVILYFPLGLAQLLTMTMLGTYPNTPDERALMDLTGEFANIITGNAKEVLLFRENATPYTLSLPMIISGKDHHVHTPYAHAPMLILQFRAEQYDFLLQIQYQTFADYMESRA